LEIINAAVDGGHKIVVFSQFVRMLKLIRAKLQESGISFVYLDGSTTDRMERINCFNHTPEIPVFLISLKAGGVGINLTAADIVIHTDPWWNPMVEDQATDRVHRLGQQRQVMVYKLITLGMVEEKLVKLQERKKAIFDAVIQNNGNPVNSLTWADIRELLEIKGE
jgi:SNF2 family DNA or RNA helicase